MIGRSGFQRHEEPSHTSEHEQEQFKLLLCLWTNVIVKTITFITKTVNDSSVEKFTKVTSAVFDCSISEDAQAAPSGSQLDQSHLSFCLFSGFKLGTCMISITQEMDNGRTDGR